MFLTSRFVVELDSDLGLQRLTETVGLMLPTRSQPNPVLQGNSIVLILSDGDEYEMTFMDENKAKAACALFEDMFFMLLDRDVSHDE